MKITIDIPTDKATALIDAFATQYNYQEEVPNPDYDADVDGSLETIPNPTNKGKFAKNVLKTFIKNVYVAAQVAPVQEQHEVDAQTLATTASTEADAIDVT